MSGPDEFHARALLATIADIEKLCEDTLSRGHTPFLDAVETAKLLRALVSGSADYRPSTKFFNQRCDLADRAGWTAMFPHSGWATVPESGEADESDDAEGAT